MIEWVQVGCVIQIPPPAPEAPAGLVRCEAAAEDCRAGGSQGVGDERLRVGEKQRMANLGWRKHDGGMPAELWMECGVGQLLLLWRCHQLRCIDLVDDDPKIN